MSTDKYAPGMMVMGVDEFDDLFFITQCFLEIKNRNKVPDLGNKILSQLQKIAYTGHRLWYSGRYGFIGTLAIRIIVEEWKEHPAILDWIKDFILSNAESGLRSVAIIEFVKTWKDDSEILLILKKYARLDSDWILQRIALIELARGWKEDSETLPCLQKYAKSDACKYSVRSELLEEIAKVWTDEPWLFNFLFDRAVNDPFERPHLLNLKEDLGLNPRVTALKALLTHYYNYPKTLELLRDRATNDPDEQLREWAQEQLKMQNGKLKEEEA